jgi:hypothetical protein
VKKAILCLLALHGTLVPCLADVIPSRRAEKNPAAEGVVKARLVELGATAAEAERQVGQLTARELGYFAQEPSRIQAAGALYWYEWLLGAGFLAVLAIIYFSVTSD